MAKWIETYNHNGKIGVLVEFSCATDFSIKTDEFKDFANGIAMQIAASKPIDIESPHTADVYLIESGEKSSKPIESDKYLLDQVYVKASDKLVRDVLLEINENLSEKIRIIRFERYE